MKKIILAFILFIHSSLIGVDFSFNLPPSISKEDYIKADRYIILMARSDNLGHAFVGWGYNDEIRKKCMLPRSFGFYPIDTKKGIISFFKHVPGEIKDDSSSTVTKKIIVQVDYRTYQKSIQVFDDWEQKISNNQQQYSLLNENCIKFLKDIAKTIDIKVPNTTIDLPEKYIEKITILNQIKHTEENIWFIDKRKDINITDEVLNLSYIKMLELDFPTKNQNNIFNQEFPNL